MEIEIRSACAEDVADLDRIQRLSPEAVLWPAEDYLGHACLVAIIDGRVAGFLASRQLAPGESEILNLAVDPAARRRGAATALLGRALAGAPGDWFLEVRETNTTARRFYSRAGFREVGRRPKYYQDSAEAAVVMRLQPCYCHK